MPRAAPHYKESLGPNVGSAAAEKAWARQGEQVRSESGRPAQLPLGLFLKTALTKLSLSCNLLSISSSLSLFLNKFIYLFIYFWLCWVFVAACGFSLVVVRGGYSSLLCAGFSLQWLLLWQSTGSRCAGFSSCGTWTQ